MSDAVDEFSLRRALRNPERTMADFYAAHDALAAELGRLGNGIAAI